MGYQERPSKMLKITLFNPQDTRLWRDLIFQKLPIKEVFETDILFKSRFMMDLGISGMGQIEVPGENISYKDIKVVN